MGTALAVPDVVTVRSLTAGYPYRDGAGLNEGRVEFGLDDVFCMRRRDARRAIAKGLVFGCEGSYLQSNRIHGPDDAFPVRAEEAWVVACGHSATGTRIPYGAIVFAVNGAAELPIPQCYWVTCDPGVTRERYPAGPYRRKFIRADHLGLPPLPDHTPYRVDLGYGFSADWGLGCFAGAGSAAVALQLAVMSGARHVHLVGLDLSWEGEVSNCYGLRHGDRGHYAHQVPAFRESLRCMRELGISWTNHSPVSQEILTV